MRLTEDVAEDSVGKLCMGGGSGMRNAKGTGKKEGWEEVEVAGVGRNTVAGRLGKVAEQRKKMQKASCELGRRRFSEGEE